MHLMEVYYAENKKDVSRMEDKCGGVQDTPEVRHQGSLRMRFSWWETFCHLFSSLVGEGGLGEVLR